MTPAIDIPITAQAQISTGVPASVIGSGLRTVVDGLDHAEGVCWSPSDQALYAGGEGGQLYRFNLEGGAVETVCTVPGASMLGLAVDGSGHVYVCDTGNSCVQRVDTAGVARPFGDSIGYPNYPVFDSTGSLWVSDSGDWGKPNGGIVRIDPDGTTERVLEGLNFANGLAIRGDWLYIVESTWPRVIRMPLVGGPTEVVAVLDQVVPDGIAFDADGGLWISCWQPNRVYRLSVDGQLDVKVDDWSGVYAPTPTNIAFAGPQLNVLALASLGTGVVTACDPGVQGSPLHLPIHH
ncbi:SMP-30/gluconolactonase/LRE family protein [Paenarthrobacter nicotinovorans]|uniref:SMP-30/gluconolactonase/LRE family protein n=1 Tax=Paenarthrobacter nicotinovorans TaxID=29320 RepID=UPI0039A52F7A